MVKTVDLVERSGALKAELLEFSARPRYDQARRDLLAAHGVHGVVRDQSQVINVLDHLLLQHRLDNGQTIVEQLRGPSKLAGARTRDAARLADVVEGIFEIHDHDDDALVVRSLLDELDYRGRNMGPEMFRPLRVGSFLIARLVPVGDGWLLSGGLSLLRRRRGTRPTGRPPVWPPLGPELVFRNPYYLE